MNLHVVFHGMMVLDEKPDGTIDAALLKTPDIRGGVDEHSYVLVKSATDDREDLSGSNKLNIVGGALGTAAFNPGEMVIFRALSIHPARVRATVNVPKPHHITGLRKSVRLRTRAGADVPFFAGDDVPNQPSEMHVAHVFSYCNITSATLSGTTWSTPATGDAIIAIHAEEPASPPVPDGDGHMRHVRAAIRKGARDINFYYVIAQAAEDPEDVMICGTPIPKFWAMSLPEKDESKQRATGAMPPTPGDTPSGRFIETNPCWRYAHRP